MNFIIAPGEWRVEVITGAGEGFMHFTLQAWGHSEEYANEGLREVRAMLADGREVFWRVRPEVEFYKDFETETSGWKGYARFSVRTTGTVEHELSGESVEVKYLGFGLPKEET